MKRTKKILVTLFCAVLLVTGTVAVTVAYLTASTTAVKNTFTVGKVEIDLDETLVDEYGVAVVPATRTEKNEYKLIPGHTYMKDPTVYVKKGSEICWVFVKVNVSDNVAAVLDGFAVNDTYWKQLVVDETTVEDVYYYVNAIDARIEQATLYPVFGQFKVKGDATLTDVTGSDAITIDAYAVQADGFVTPEAAWKAASTTWGE